MGRTEQRETDRRAGRTAQKSLSAALALLVLVSAGAPPASAEEQTPIKIAVEGAYPPFNYLDQNNELQGFEVDLLRALCEKMQAQCILVQHDWDGIIRGLLNHDYDAIMSSLEITPRRMKRIAFSRRYYFIPPAFIGTADNTIKTPTPEALAGKRIGAVDRSEHARYIGDVYKTSELQTYAKLEEANLDLLTGRLDFVIGDKLSLQKFLESREGACCRFVADAPVDPAFHGRGFGIGLRKDDENLRLRFDAAIGAIRSDGTYDRIRARYFPFDLK